MKISKHFEQGIYVLLILATQEGQGAVKSQTLSEKLEVSDSSLKKILRKLVVADLITSNASKDGGFQLNRSIEDITLKDVIEVISNGDVIEYEISHLSRRIFFNDQHIKDSEMKVKQQLNYAIQAFKEKLNELPLVELLEDEYFKHKLVDWNDNDRTEQ